MGRKKTKHPIASEPLRYGVKLRDRIITRFRYPEEHVAGEGDNRELDGEIRLASGVFAVLRDPAVDVHPYAWNEHSYNSAHHVANVIGGRVVFLTAEGVEEIDMYRLVAGSTEVKPRGRQEGLFEDNDTETDNETEPEEVGNVGDGP